MRSIPSIFCGVLICLCWTGTVQSQEEVVAEIQRTNTPPTIDGLGDDPIWAMATAHGTDEFFTVGGEEPEDDADLSVTWKALWDDTNLYVIVDVMDDVIVVDEECNWDDDGVEFYIDAQNLDVDDYRPANNPEIPAYQLTGIAGNSIDQFCGETRIPDDSTSVFTWGINSYDASDPLNTEDDETQYPQGADTSTSVIIDENHWSFEVAFPWEALEETPANIQAAGEMGFGIAFNDDDDGGTRDTQIMWETEAADLWMRSDTFPSVALSSETVSAGEVVPELQAGDADRDLDFDQFDLIQVQIAAKYLSGNPATWGEGDWNGAPGGSQESPPAGNGLFDQIDIIAALGSGNYLTGPYAALAGGSGTAGDNQTSVIYDPGTGEVAVDAPAGMELTSINLDSAAGIFTADAAANLGGSFDNDADGNIFKATFGGSFGSISFGNVAQTGLAQDFVLNDLTVVGSLAGGGSLGDVDLIYVPEPSAAMLAVLGLLGTLGRRRSRCTRA